VFDHPHLLAQCHGIGTCEIHGQRVFITFIKVSYDLVKVPYLPSVYCPFDGNMFRGLGLSRHHSLCDTLVTSAHLCPIKLWKRDRNSTKQKENHSRWDTMDKTKMHMLAFYPTTSKHLFKLSYLIFNFATSTKFVMQIVVLME
jgi:hypothetical protein